MAAQNDLFFHIYITDHACRGRSDAAGGGALGGCIDRRVRPLTRTVDPGRQAEDSDTVNRLAFSRTGPGLRQRRPARAHRPSGILTTWHKRVQTCLYHVCQLLYYAM